MPHTVVGIRTKTHCLRIQDMEKERSLPLRHDPQHRARVAHPYNSMAS